MVKSFETSILSKYFFSIDTSSAKIVDLVYNAKTGQTMGKIEFNQNKPHLSRYIPVVGGTTACTVSDVSTVCWSSLGRK